MLSAVSLSLPAVSASIASLTVCDELTTLLDASSDEPLSMALSSVKGALRSHGPSRISRFGGTESASVTSVPAGT